MSEYLSQFETAVNPTLLERCRAMNLNMVVVDSQGRLQQHYFQPGAECEQALMGAPVIERLVVEAVEIWNSQEMPTPRTLTEGLWVIPLEIKLRRERVGYQLVVCLTSELVRSELFGHALQQCEYDRELGEKYFEGRAVMTATEVARLGALLYWMNDDRNEVERHSVNNESLSIHLSETYEELTLVYKLSEQLSLGKSPDLFIQEALEEACSVIGLRWAAFQLTDHSTLLDNIIAENILVGATPVPAHLLYDIGQELVKRYPERSATIVTEPGLLGVKGVETVADELLTIPIWMNDHLVGLIYAGNKTNGESMTSVDSKLFSTVAQNLSVFLDNARLYEDQHDMFMGTLRALVNSIDAKDSYTCGHSERVAWLSRELAAAAGLDDETVQRIHLSALVHDIGKIGVPEAVLCKPGRLTDEEFDLIKLHPEIGYRILKDIRQMKDLLPGVLHHHERYDGRGYPHQLAGDDIPLFGRVIALADSFDAMSSDRTYRSRLPREQVLEEFEKCSGTQFDPALAKVFVTLDFTEYDHMLESSRCDSVELISNAEELK